VQVSNPAAPRLFFTGRAGGEKKACRVHKDPDLWFGEELKCLGDAYGWRWLRGAAHLEILLLLLFNRTTAQPHDGFHIPLLNGFVWGVLERTRRTAQTLDGFEWLT
jgi:hypothetical protein